jgi:phospholipase C
MTAPGQSTPIQHVIVCCQENHSFDHYFGSYTGVPAGHGIRPGFTQPDGSGGVVEPFHFATLTDGPSDPYHSWADIHREWDQGKMDGFYTTNGINGSSRVLPSQDMWTRLSRSIARS